MIDAETINDLICSGKGCDDVKIAACKSLSGKVKELVYCQVDHCFYVTVDGHERLRSDMRETAYNFFSGPALG